MYDNVTVWIYDNDFIYIDNDNNALCMIMYDNVTVYIST